MNKIREEDKVGVVSKVKRQKNDAIKELMALTTQEPLAENVSIAMNKETDKEFAEHIKQIPRAENVSMANKVDIKKTSQDFPQAKKLKGIIKQRYMDNKIPILNKETDKKIVQAMKSRDIIKRKYQKLDVVLMRNPLQNVCDLNSDMSRHCA